MYSPGSRIGGGGLIGMSIWDGGVHVFFFFFLTVKDTFENQNTPIEGSQNAVFFSFPLLPSLGKGKEGRKEGRWELGRGEGKGKIPPARFPLPLSPGPAERAHDDNYRAQYEGRKIMEGKEWKDGNGDSLGGPPLRARPRYP